MLFLEPIHPPEETQGQITGATEDHVKTTEIGSLTHLTVLTCKLILLRQFQLF